MLRGIEHKWFVITFQWITSSIRIIFDNLISFKVFFDCFQWIIPISMPLPTANFVRIVQVLVHGQPFNDAIIIQVGRKQFQNNSLVVNLFTTIRVPSIIFYEPCKNTIEYIRKRNDFLGPIWCQPAFVTENGCTQLMGISKYRAQKLMRAFCNSSGVSLRLTKSTIESSFKRVCQFFAFSKSHWTLPMPSSFGSCKFTWNVWEFFSFSSFIHSLLPFYCYVRINENRKEFHGT